MTHVPTIREAPGSIRPTSRVHDSVKSVGERLRAAMADPSVPIIAAFCLLGLIVMLIEMSYFPDLGIGIEQLEQWG